MTHADKELERLAKAATPGKRTYDPEGQIIWGPNGEHIADMRGVGAGLHVDDNGKLTAALDPQTVLELLERLRGLEAEIAQDMAKAKREQMEADCRAVCHMCAEGDMPWPNVHQLNALTHGYDGRFNYCRAHNIRKAWAKAHPEEARIQGVLQKYQMEVDKMETRTAEIVAELYHSLELLGARSDLLSIVGSWGDSLTDDQVLENLKAWNAATAEECGDAGIRAACGKE